MIENTMELERDIKFLEKRLSDDSFKSNDFSIAVCNLVLHIAKKETSEVTHIEESEIPEHFVLFTELCEKYFWPQGTIRNNLNRLENLGDKSVAKMRIKDKGTREVYVDGKKIFSLLARKAKSTLLRLRAERTLGIMNQLESIKKHKSL